MGRNQNENHRRFLPEEMKTLEVEPRDSEDCGQITLREQKWTLIKEHPQTQSWGTFLHVPGWIIELVQTKDFSGPPIPFLLIRSNYCSSLAPFSPY